MRRREAKAVTARAVSPEALDLCLTAQGLSLKGDREALGRAVHPYQRALALDSTYGEAWAGLATTYLIVADAYFAPVEVMPKAKAAALEAIALDDSLALAHAILAEVYWEREWDWTAGRREHLRALELDERSSWTHLIYGVFLLYAADDVRGAEEQLQAAAAHDPFDPWIPRFEAFGALAGREYDRDLRLAAQAQQLAASTGSAYFDDLTARVRAAMGDWGERVRVYERLPESVRDRPHFVLAVCYAQLGEGNRAREILEQFEAESRQHYAKFLTRIGLPTHGPPDGDEGQ